MAILTKELRIERFVPSYFLMVTFLVGVDSLAYTIKIIRYFFIKKLTKGELVGIIDSFPSLLCKPVRNRQAKLLNQIAKVGYNSTKKSYFYGLKIHMIVTKTGFPITY